MHDLFDTQNLEATLINHIMTTTKQPTLDLLLRLKDTHPPATRKLVLDYAAMALLQPTTFNLEYDYDGCLLIDNYRKIRDCIKYFVCLDQQTISLVFKPMLFQLGVCIVASSDYLVVLEEMLAHTFILDLFVDEDVWGLVEHSYHCYMAYTPKKFGNGDKIGMEDKELKNVENSDSNLITLLPPFAGHPAVIDSLFEKFIYDKKSEVCKATLNKSVYELRGMSLELDNSMKNYIKKIHLILIKILSHSKKTKTNFISYLRMLFFHNIDRSKIMFSRRNVISDGFIFNLVGILRILSTRILSDGNIAIEPGWTNPTFSSFKFQSAIYHSRIIFTNFLYSEVLRGLDTLEEADTMEEKSMYNAYNIIIYGCGTKNDDIFAVHLCDYVINRIECKKRVEEGSNLYLVDEYSLFCIHLYLNINRLLHLDNNNLSERLLASNLNVHDKIRIATECSNKFTKHEILIESYCEADKVDQTEKYRCRNVLNSILKDKIDVFKLKNDSNCDRFLQCVVGDTESLLSMGLSSLMEINTIPENGLNGTTVNSHPNNHVIATRRTKAIFMCLQELLDLVNTLTPMLARGRTFGQLVNILNYNLKILVGPRSVELKLDPKIKRSAGFEPKELLRKILKFYIKALKSTAEKSLFKLIAADKISFRKEFLEKAITICGSKGILNEEEIGSLKIILEGVDKVREKKEVEIPVNYLDPITSSIMESPVKLTTSGVIVDKSTFDMLILSTGIDPFNREKMENNGFEMMNELQEEIKRFMCENGML